MNDFRRDILAILAGIAPEVDPASLDPASPLRDQVDLDSMDWLKVIVGVHERLHVDIPETDYARLRSLEDWDRYLEEKLPVRTP